MQIDESTPGSFANAEAVRVLKGWLIALYVVDCLICVMGALSLKLSMTYGFWILVKSLFFSYFIGIIAMAIVIRLGGRLIGITKITPVGFLKYCVVLACLSVLMGIALVYRASSITSARYSATLTESLSVHAASSS